MSYPNGMSGYDRWLSTPPEVEKCRECDRDASKDGLCLECWDQGYADAREDERNWRE